MSYSVGEASDLCIKAARGSGKPWGIAEEIGWAVRWLVRAGLPGPERLAALLGGVDDACPVTLGLAVSDTGDITRLHSAGVVAEPVFLLAFLSRLAPSGRAFRVTIDGRPVRVWADGTDLGGALPVAGRIDVSGDVPAPPRRRQQTRVPEIAPEAFSALNELAARTYAPATDASRERGAGAGLSDND